MNFCLSHVVKGFSFPFHSEEFKCINLQNLNEALSGYHSRAVGTWYINDFWLTLSSLLVSDSLIIQKASTTFKYKPVLHTCSHSVLFIVSMAKKLETTKSIKWCEKNRNKALSATTTYSLLEFHITRSAVQVLVRFCCNFRIISMDTDWEYWYIFHEDSANHLYVQKHAVFSGWRKKSSLIFSLALLFLPVPNYREPARAWNRLHRTQRLISAFVAM